LLRHTPGDSDYDDIQQIRANSNRAASLTRQLLAFSRQQTLRPQVLQLPDIVSAITQLLRRLIGEKIQLQVSHDRDLGAVRADPTQVEQVIVNLVVNARDAMQEASRKAGGDGSGALMLATRRVPAADVRAMGSDILPIADYTALVVRDTGGGIPADILGKIWEPFFTTKGQGRGTGLGLSTVYGIVKQSGGFIFADNVPAQDGLAAGARFTVYLPVHHGAVESAARPREEITHWAGGGEILLVEDEDAVRVVAERALSRAGYQVVTASDGEEGVEAVMARRESGGAMFDLIVSDVVMPAMDGPAMARAIRAVEPNLPVLFMSGYAEGQLRREIDIENMHFIPKPFSEGKDKDSIDRQKALEAALAQIDRAFGKGSAMRLGAKETMQVEAISTGSLGLDIALGIGGLPRGRIIEIYGPESSGKTTLALHAIAEAQKGGGTAAFVDAEHALDPVYAKKLGVDIDNLILTYLRSPKALRFLATTTSADLHQLFQSRRPVLSELTQSPLLH
ncbi:hypothetical protein E4T56_gene16869, partial [Termitomyces sp. T112]